MKAEMDKNERRGAERFPIEREVCFKIQNRIGEERGSGRTINISSSGVLLTTDRYLIPGRALELSMSWPAQLDSKVSLRLVARGRVVRSEESRAAIKFQKHEFRTQAVRRKVE